MSDLQYLDAAVLEQDHFDARLFRREVPFGGRYFPTKQKIYSAG